jgi:hypothetical protein
MTCAEARRTLAALAGVALAALPPPAFAFFAAFFSFAFSSRSRFRFAASRCLAACNGRAQTQVRGKVYASRVAALQHGKFVVGCVANDVHRHTMAVHDAAHAPALQGPSCWWPLA